MLDITSEQRRALRASAHALNPVVSISQNGLSESVLKEIEIAVQLVADPTCCGELKFVELPSPSSPLAL